MKRNSSGWGKGTLIFINCIAQWIIVHTCTWDTGTRREADRGRATRADVRAWMAGVGGSARACSGGHATQKSVHTKPPWLPKTTPTLAFLACLLTLLYLHLRVIQFSAIPPTPPTRFILTLFRFCTTCIHPVAMPTALLRLGIAAITCLPYCVLGVQVALQERERGLSVSF